MKIPTSMPRLKCFRYPREIIAFAVWAYHRFAMSTADVEDLLAERGVIVSREAVRLWINRFGRHFADCIRRNRSRPNDKWHLDDGAARQALRRKCREGRDHDPWQEALAVARD